MNTSQILGDSARRSRLYLLLAIGTQILSLVDFAYTVFGIGRIPGMKEGNPFFAVLLGSPWMAAAYKLVVIPAALWAMYKFRARPLARFGLWLCFAVFAYLGVKAAYMLVVYRQYLFA